MANPPSSFPKHELVVDFDLGDEPATLERNARVRLYQQLVACVDHLDLAGAMELVELCCLFTDCASDERAALLRVCRAVPKP